jgi:hypothetical protein
MTAGKVWMRFSIMARKRRAICILLEPQARISAKARWGKERPQEQLMSRTSRQLARRPDTRSL